MQDISTAPFHPRQETLPETIEAKWPTADVLALVSLILTVVCLPSVLLGVHLEIRKRYIRTAVKRIYKYIYPFRQETTVDVNTNLSDDCDRTMLLHAFSGFTEVEHQVTHEAEEWRQLQETPTRYTSPHWQWSISGPIQLLDSTSSVWGPLTPSDSLKNPCAPRRWKVLCTFKNNAALIQGVHLWFTFYNIQAWCHSFKILIENILILNLFNVKHILLSKSIAHRWTLMPRHLNYTLDEWMRSFTLSGPLPLGDMTIQSNYGCSITCNEIKASSRPVLCRLSWAFLRFLPAYASKKLPQRSMWKGCCRNMYEC